MEMVEVKTSELIGPALDWSVAKSIGQKIDDSRGKELRINLLCQGLQSPWIPSGNWHQGGPLIENFMIGFGVYSDAYFAVIGVNEISGAENGHTHLIAACRAIVAAKLGDTVSVPKELTQ